MFYFLLCVFNQQKEVKLLRWAGPEGSKVKSYEEWISENPLKPFKFSIKRFYNIKSGETVAIITEQDIYNSISSELNQLISDLEEQGFNVIDITISGGTPEDLRGSLQELYNNYQLKGALFIGNLPVAWFEIKNDFNTYGYADFPIDLFYMDLDGVWLDTMNTGNGKYDGHTGNMLPEIYIGRLTPTGIGDDTLLIKNYLNKDHRFRNGEMMLLKRALFFCDDDWIPWADYWAYNLSLLYKDTMNYWDPETTKASIYRVKLDTLQAWVSVFAHSWPGGHQFTYNNHSSYDYYYSSEYISQVPPSNFYNFFSCSFSRYTENGYGGGCAIFNNDYGVGSIGSTKTGSMLDFEYFYEPLSNGKNLGEAFKDWFNYIISNGVTFDELCWHYGMTLCGDPFLIPQGHSFGFMKVHVDSKGTDDDYGAVVKALRNNEYRYISEDTTNLNGDCFLLLPQGLYEVYFSKEGFFDTTISVNITKNETLNINMNLYPVVTIFSSDFEIDNGGLTGTGSWEWGDPNYSGSWGGPSDAHSGINCWGTNLTGDYPNSDNSTLTTPLIYLPDERIILEYFQWFRSQGLRLDGGNVKVSTDGIMWNVVHPLYPDRYDTIISASNAGIPNEWGFTSDGGRSFWDKITFDLSQYKGNSVYVRFHFGSNVAVVRPGWYIDDIKIGYVDYAVGTEEDLAEIVDINTINKGRIRIEFSRNENINMEIKLIDITGRVIYKNNLSKTFKEFIIDVNKRGIYFLNINSKERRFTKKVILF